MRVCECVCVCRIGFYRTLSASMAILSGAFRLSMLITVNWVNRWCSNVKSPSHRCTVSPWCVSLTKQAQRGLASLSWVGAQPPGKPPRPWPGWSCWGGILVSSAPWLRPTDRVSEDQKRISRSSGGRGSRVKVWPCGSFCVRVGGRWLRDLEWEARDTSG